MGNEIKYTAEGKKVVVIDNLNSTQYIVQEIFVNDDGEEFPGGEKFVAENLFDKPVKSWATREQERQQKELKYLSDNYENERKEWQTKLDSLRTQMSQEFYRLSGHLNWLKKIAKEPHEEEIKQIIRDIHTFLSPEKKYFCKMYCGIPEIIEWSLDGESRILDMFYDRSFDGMRLVTLFGRTDGSLRWKLCRYGDGSGSYDEYIICDSYEKAVAWAQDKFNNMKPSQITKSCIEKVLSYGCKVDVEHIKSAYQSLIESNGRDLEKYKKDVVEREERIRELTEERNNLIENLNKD